MKFLNYTLLILTLTWSVIRRLDILMRYAPWTKLERSIVSLSESTSITRSKEPLKSRSSIWRSVSSELLISTVIFPLVRVGKTFRRVPSCISHIEGLLPGICRVVEFRLAKSMRSSPMVQLTTRPLVSMLPPAVEIAFMPRP